MLSLPTPLLAALGRSPPQADSDDEERRAAGDEEREVQTGERKAACACSRRRSSLADLVLNIAGAAVTVLRRASCTECRRRFPVRDGIPVMLLDEALPPA